MLRYTLIFPLEKYVNVLPGSAGGAALDALIGERGNVGEGPETMSLLKIVSFIVDALQVYGIDNMHPGLNEAETIHKCCSRRNQMRTKTL